MRRPPKFVHGYRDRHGRARFYFRRAGFAKVPLPGLPWSPEFMDAYEQALAGQPPIEPGKAKLKPGTMDALALSYLASPAFTTLADNSRLTYRRAIERFCRQHGSKPATGLQRQHIVKLMSGLADRPQAANQLRKILRALMQHAVEIGLRADDPTRDVKLIRIKSDGFHSWTEREIDQFEARWPIGLRERLAFALLLFTGQRRSDVVRMGRQHIEDGMLRVKQDKTGAELLIPVHAKLQEIIAATPSGHLNFVLTRDGRPLRLGSFSNWFKDACVAAGLPHCSAHGLRKSAARRLAEAGCTPNEISAITGHQSLNEVARYTRAVDQKRLATIAMAKVKG
jgi:integrase